MVGEWRVLFQSTAREIRGDLAGVGFSSMIFCECHRRRAVRNINKPKLASVRRRWRTSAKSAAIFTRAKRSSNAKSFFSPSLQIFFARLRIPRRKFRLYATALQPGPTPTRRGVPRIPGVPARSDRTLGGEGVIGEAVEVIESMEGRREAVEVVDSRRVGAIGARIVKSKLLYSFSGYSFRIFLKGDARNSTDKRFHSDVDCFHTYAYLYHT